MKGQKEFHYGLKDEIKDPFSWKHARASEIRELDYLESLAAAACLPPSANLIEVFESRVSIAPKALPLTDYSRAVAGRATRSLFIAYRLLGERALAAKNLPEGRAEEWFARWLEEPLGPEFAFPKMEDLARLRQPSEVRPEPKRIEGKSTPAQERAIDILKDVESLVDASDDEVEQHGVVASLRIKLRSLREDPNTSKLRRMAVTAVDAALLFNTAEFIAEKAGALRSALEIALASEVPDRMALRRISSILEAAEFDLLPPNLSTVKP